MSIKTLKFKLFANCIPVKGANRSVICDVQRENYELIPNSLYEILTENKNLSFEDYVSKYGEEFRETLSEYFDFLIGQEFGFWTDTPEKFPEMNMEWFHPSPITNAIIDWNMESDYDLTEITRQLDDLGCENIEFRFFDYCSLNEISKKLVSLIDSRVSSLDLYIKYSEEMTLEAINEFLHDNLRIEKLYIHSAPKDQFEVKKDGLMNLRAVHYFSQEINSEAHCGVVHPNYFSTNIPAFLEAMSFNSCLNRKISVDTLGRIKNCPSMVEDYGNVSTVKLAEVLNQSTFKDSWGITKDDVKVCQDCEFRYICTDCRAYTKADLKLGKPQKCGYDPYTNVWEPLEGSK